MKIRLLLQVGAKNNKPEDLYRLADSKDKIFNWAMDQIYNDPITVKKEHRLADGSPHLIEFELTKEYCDK